MHLLTKEMKAEPKVLEETMRAWEREIAFVNKNPEQSNLV
jgi:hypothetical protein